MMKSVSGVRMSHQKIGSRMHLEAFRGLLDFPGWWETA
jgi:hypothetical protein